MSESGADMVEVFTGRTLLNKDGDFVDPEEALRNKVVGIYFSAGWCPPCRDFTPILCDFYTELVEESEPPAQFEIVFVSSDKSSDDMVEYYHDMHGDWLALPWTDDYKQSVLPLKTEWEFGLRFNQCFSTGGLCFFFFFLVWHTIGRPIKVNSDVEDIHFFCYYDILTITSRLE